MATSQKLQRFYRVLPQSERKAQLLQFYLNLPLYWCSSGVERFSKQPTKLRQGNVFSLVCLSVCPQRGLHVATTMMPLVSHRSHSLPPPPFRHVQTCSLLPSCYCLNLLYRKITFATGNDTEERNFIMTFKVKSMTL